MVDRGGSFALTRVVLIVAAALAVAGCATNPFAPAEPPPVAAAPPPVPGVAPGSTQDFFLNVGDRVFFDEKSAALNDIATTTLNKQVAWLSRYQMFNVTIEGHADERGNAAFNVKLSSSRAVAVREYLVSKGIESGRIRTVGRGREGRAAKCDNISCWSQNRRAVTVLSERGEIPRPVVRRP
jgi:peptidoglycan-associated lipoprotein